VAFYLYVVTAIFAGGALVLRRRVDIYPIAVYFAGPAILSELSDATYVTFSIVSAAIALGAYSDRVMWPAHKEIDPRLVRSLIRVLHGMAFVGVGLTVALYGPRELFTIKTEQERSAALHLLWSASSTTGFVVSWMAGTRKSTATFALHLAAQLLAGDRTHPVLAIGAVVLHACYVRKRPHVRLSKWSVGTAAVALGLISFLGKDIYGATQYMIATGASMTEAINVRVERGNAIERSYEATHTQYILDRVLVDNFQLEPEYLWATPLHLVPGAARYSGSDLHHFSEAIKSRYFPGLSPQTGVAGNYWAEGLAVGGWAGLGVFLVIYLTGIRLFNAVLRRGNSAIRALFAAPAFTWVFYIHRCALFQIVSHEKKFLIVGLCAIGIAWALRMIARDVAIRNAPA
jgi:hypothetical protein